MKKISKARHIDKPSITRVLVRGTNWIGDVVMSLPALEAVRANFPGRTIAVLAKPWVLPLYKNHPAVDQVIPYTKDKGYPWDLGEVIRTARFLRKQEFDLAVLFQNAFEAAVLAFLGGIRVRIGYNTDGRGFLLSHPVTRNLEVLKQHQVEYYLSILRPMGWEAPTKDPSLFVAKADEEAVEKLLASHGVSATDRVLALSPGATYGPAKRWPVERFATIGNWAADRWGTKVIAVGSAGEKEVCRKLIENLKHPAIDLSGATTLGQAMALIKRCQFFVCNDSGLMHVGAALGVPTVAVFGSTDPVATGPRGKAARIVIEPVECSPCLAPECRYGHYRCLLAIGPERVWKELETLKQAPDKAS